MSPATRTGIIAILGAPNAGKSTLVNALVGEKVSIVTHKVQTTRFPLRGVAMRGEAQLVLIDTPGIFAPRRRLDRAMVASAWRSAEDADAIVHLIDAPAYSKPEGPADARANDDVARILEGLAKAKRQAILALNKIDSMPRENLLAAAARLNAAGVYRDVFMISALKGDGVEDLAAHLAALAPPGPWLYPEDQAGDAPARVLAAEITREKLMLRLHEELPYDLTVETELWQERKDGSVRIDQIVFVAREGQKKIAIGEGGQSIKVVGELARKELETLFERRVHLFLHVKVRENWSEERGRYIAWGLDYES